MYVGAGDPTVIIDNYSEANSKNIFFALVFQNCNIKKKQQQKKKWYK